MSIELPTHPAEDVCRRLREDPLTAAMFAGGIYTDHGGGDGNDVHPINPVDTPDAYLVDGDFKTLRPCLLISVSTDVPISGGAQRQITLRLGGYQAAGYSEIRDGFARVRQVLHKTNVGTYLPTRLRDTELGYYIEYQDTPGSGLTDPSLLTGNGKRPACYEWSRYTVYTEPVTEPL